MFNGKRVLSKSSTRLLMAPSGIHVRNLRSYYNWHNLRQAFGGCRLSSSGENGLHGTAERVHVGRVLTFSVLC